MFHNILADKEVPGKIFSMALRFATRLPFGKLRAERKSSLLFVSPPLTRVGYIMTPRRAGLFPNYHSELIVDVVVQRRFQPPEGEAALCSPDRKVWEIEV